MKKLLYLLGGLVALFVVAVVVLIFTLGSIVKTAVNHVGPTITQTTFVLNSAEISPLSGSGTLKELTIGNPKGWSTEHAFFLKEISISLVPKSVTGDHIVINSIVIDNPEIIYETTLTNSNLQDLVKNIQHSTGGTNQPAPGDAKPETKPAQPTKIEIKSFRMRNVTIKVAGAGNLYTVTLPELVMENLGTKEGGLTPNQLATAIIKEISAQVAKAALNSVAKKGLLDKAGEGLRSLLGGRK